MEDPVHALRFAAVRGAPTRACATFLRGMPSATDSPRGARRGTIGPR